MSQLTVYFVGRAIFSYVLGFKCVTQLCALASVLICLYVWTSCTYVLNRATLVARWLVRRVTSAFSMGSSAGARAADAQRSLEFTQKWSTILTG